MSQSGQLYAALTNDDLPADPEIEEIIDFFHEQLEDEE